MLFNSIDFAIFLPIVFILYWFVTNKSLGLQNFLIVAASYLFYGWWDWRFLTLILFSSLVDYLVGLGLLKQENQTKRKVLLWTSILVNIGLLGFFKYYNFFIDNFISAFSFFGSEIKANSLNIILPVGISFYTFQTLSYSIDVYKKKLQPTKDFMAFAAFVSFFPQLVAGPIERATHLLPQFFVKRTFSSIDGTEGMRLILWGLFKKVVVADNCAIFVNSVFGNYQNATSLELVLGTIFFAFQIYGDFSGYSDIAIGTARLFGFHLMTNFRTPYFARDIAEFWRRWHISLTTWFRDYLYIPLGGSKHGKWRAIGNTFIVFIVSGFWHGANWTFIAWGFLNALYFLPLLITNRNRTHLDTIAESSNLPSIKEFFQVVITFFLVCISWVFFRSDSLSNSFDYLFRIFNPGSGIGYQGIGTSLILMVVSVLIIFEWLFRKENLPFKRWSANPFLRYTAYTIIIFFILFFGSYVNPQSFIYFQF
jgi:alginate O-acetyltransferase complex protein AlgI